MVEAFLDFFAEQHGLRRKAITPEALAPLTGYHWPGNVRELRNIVERLLIMGNDPIEVGDLPDEVQPKRPVYATAMGVSPGSTPLRAFREASERGYIEATLRANDWNVSRTAEQLGVERTNLHKKIRQYEIERDRD